MIPFVQQADFASLSSNISLNDEEFDELSRLLLMLADHRVLYVPFEAEIPNLCEDSIRHLRKELGVRAQRLSGGSGLSAFLVALQGVCREFITRLDMVHKEYPPEARRGMGYEMIFYQMLGEFRGRFGLYLQGLLTEHPMYCPPELLPLIGSKEIG